MKKQTIRKICNRMFIAGKNNLADRLFDEYFEKAYSELNKAKYKQNEN